LVSAVLEAARIEAGMTPMRRTISFTAWVVVMSFMSLAAETGHRTLIVRGLSDADTV
jgi:hypothetical protein